MWRGLLAAQSAGKVRHVGVSNFNRPQIEALVACTGVWPAINELEFHPWVSSTTRELVRWCHEHGIVVIAYGSLGGSTNRASGGDAVSVIASAHNASAARVLLRWAIQQGVVVIPGATSAAHIGDNLALLRAAPPVLELSDTEMRELDAAGGARAPASFHIWKGLCTAAADGGGCQPSV